mgnify:CR=1 FL=1
MNATKTISGLDFVNANEKVCLWYVSVGSPAGETIAILDDTTLPFELSELEGEVNEQGDFVCTNLNTDGGLDGWQFRDFGGNTITNLKLVVDAGEWDKQNAEWIGE